MVRTVDGTLGEMESHSEEEEHDLTYILYLVQAPGGSDLRPGDNKRGDKIYLEGGENCPH